MSRLKRRGYHLTFGSFDDGAEANEMVMLSYEAGIADLSSFIVAVIQERKR